MLPLAGTCKNKGLRYLSTLFILKFKYLFLLFDICYLTCRCWLLN
jgi:hypothetical protein